MADKAPVPQKDFWAGTAAPSQTATGKQTAPAPSGGGNEDWKIWDQGSEGQSEQPDSILGGIGKRLGGIATSMFGPAESPEEAAGGSMVPPGVIRAVKGIANYPKQVGEGLGRASQYAHEAHDLPAGNALQKGLGYARAGTTALSALNPLTQGTEASVNPLVDQGRLGEATGTGLTDAALLATPLMAKEVPLRSRALNTFKSIGDQAANVPVNLSETAPALGGFKQSVATGGKNAPVMTKLGKRIDAIPTQGDINFPEARNFYTNVSRASARPGFLRRAIESPGMPDLRRNVGNVREALNTDLTNAADTIGRGEDYTGAMKEYANNAKLRTLGKRVGLAAGAEAARRSGLLGKVANKVAGE